MEHLDRPMMEPAQKTIAKHQDFANSVYKELQSSFDIEEQVEILSSLYQKLYCFYSESEEKALKEADINKEKLNILRRLQPKD